eukprot:350156-Chlamydomonas_euryale.AAC.3
MPASMPAWHNKNSGGANAAASVSGRDPRQFLRSLVDRCAPAVHTCARPGTSWCEEHPALHPFVPTHASMRALAHLTETPTRVLTRMPHR